MPGRRPFSRGEGLVITLWGTVATAASFFPNSTGITSLSSETSSTQQSTPSVPLVTITTTYFHGQQTFPEVVYQPCLQDNGQVCSRSEQPWYNYGATNYINPYALAGYDRYGTAAPLSFSCAAIWTSSLNQWLMTAPVSFRPLVPESTQWETVYGATYEEDDIFPISTVGTFTTPGEYMFPKTLTTDTIVTTTIAESVIWVYPSILYSYTPSLVTNYPTTKVGWLYSSFSPAYYLSQFPFTASSPCCGSCTIQGTNVQVFFWPTPAPSPPVSTLVNSEGFTFISPSVYVAFQSLQAKNMCGAYGSAVNSTTIAFSEGELSTAIAYRYNTTEYAGWPPYLSDRYSSIFTEATFGITSCSDVTNSFYQYNPGNYDTRTFVESDALLSQYGSVENFSPEFVHHYTITYNPCSPTLSAPPQLFTLNPLWSECVKGIDPLYDPPYVLSQGNGLAAFTTATHITYIPETAKVAAPASTPIPVIATMTSVAKADPTSTTSNKQPAQSSVPNNRPAQSPSVVNVDPPSRSTIPRIPSVQSLPKSTKNKPVAQTSVAQTSVAQNPPANSDPPAEASSPVSHNPPTNPPSVTSPSPLTVITIGSSTITANSVSAFVMSTQTLSRGSQITHAGTIYLLASNGASLIVGDTTTQLPGNPFAVSSASEYVIGSQTLTAGSPAITVSGTVLSLQAGGSSVVIGSTTIPLSELMNTEIQYLVASQTLVAGGAPITVNGAVVSLQTGGKSVVVGTKTEDLSMFLGSSTTFGGLGGIIATIGGFVVASSTGSKTTTSTLQVGGYVGYSGTTFTGVGSHSMNKGEHSILITAILVGMSVIAVWVL